MRKNTSIRVVTVGWATSMGLNFLIYENIFNNNSSSGDFEG